MPVGERGVHLDGLGRLTRSTDFGGVTRSYFLDRSVNDPHPRQRPSEVSTYDRAASSSPSQSNAGGNRRPERLARQSRQAERRGDGAGWNNLIQRDAMISTIGPTAYGRASAGQTSGVEGGGNVTNEVPIDQTKAYEFTYYFKLSDLDKHYVFFGLSPYAVENLSDGAANDNPYFFYAYNGMEAANFTADKWYKVVGYVLPQGSALSSTPLGGVYDVATGQKVIDNYSTFRWKSTSPPSSTYARFFDFYGDTSVSLYSTYFYQPEIRQVSTATAIGPDRSTSLYRYDNLGRLWMTVDPTGRRQYMMYDSVGRKVADIDADGSVTEYRYDGNDNLTSTTLYATKLRAAGSPLVDQRQSDQRPSLAAAGGGCPRPMDLQIHDAAQRRCKGSTAPARPPSHL